MANDKKHQHSKDPTYWYGDCTIFNFSSLIRLVFLRITLYEKHPYSSALHDINS